MSVRCLSKFGGDLLYFSENGVIPISKLAISTTQNFGASIPSASNLASPPRPCSTASQTGWRIHVCPKRAHLILNIPQGTGASIQYVYNTYSKGWSTFSGWNASDFVEYNGTPTSASEPSWLRRSRATPISGPTSQPSVIPPTPVSETREQLLPLLARPLFASTGSLTYTLGIAQDFSGSYSESIYVSGAGSGAIWDTSLWDTGLWGGAFTLQRNWRTIVARGGSP